MGAEVRKAREPNERLCRGTENRPIGDWQMNGWTSWACDTVKARRVMVDDLYAMLSRLRMQVCIIEYTVYRRIGATE